MHQVITLPSRSSTKGSCDLRYAQSHVACRYDIEYSDRYEYCGHTVSYRRKSISYKTHKSVLNDEADWIITKDTQAAIIDEETWQTVHKMRESGRRRKEHVWDKGPLNGFLYCPDCGSKLYFNHPSAQNQRYYSCGYYLHYKKCTSTISAETSWTPRCWPASALTARLRGNMKRSLSRWWSERPGARARMP